MNYVEKLKETILSMLKGQDARVILFGSRARGDNTGRADIDIGVIPGKEFDRKKLVFLRDYIEETLNIPYKVDIVDFSMVSAGFREMTLKEAIVWKD